MRERVACYVVRGEPGRAELLVFDHLDPGMDDAGVQVPAGGIEPGETVLEAAVRELREETGLTGAAFVAVLELGGTTTARRRSSSSPRPAERPTVGGTSSTRRTATTG